jgi:hemerythrin-like domain-containing protein
MSSARRHESLIPLSREHNHGLMLCLRVRRMLGLPSVDETLVCDTAADIAQFVATDLAAHFQAEEEVLFPAMRGFSEVPLINELVSEHRELEALAKRLSELKAKELVGALGRFADLLESHIRKEERALFPLYERLVSEEAAAEIGYAVKLLIGDGIHSRERYAPFR